MRDDITDLIDSKIDLFKTKLDLFNKLLLNESEKIFFIKSDKIEKAAQIIDYDNEIIDEINVIDYKIRSLESIFSKKVGIKQNEIYSFLLSLDDNNAERLIEIINILSLTMKELMMKKNQFTLLMEQASRKTKKDIENFNDYLKIHQVGNKSAPRGR